MSWTNDKMGVWMCIIGIIIYLMLHGVAEVGYLRSITDRHEETLTQMNHLLKPLNYDSNEYYFFGLEDHFDDFMGHTHVYHDGSVRR